MSHFNLFQIDLKGPFRKEDKYDVVYIGNVLPNIDDPIYNSLQSEYVFLFTTKLNQDVTSPMYGQVNVDLLNFRNLAYFFSENLLDKDSIHILHEEELIINDFAEIAFKKSGQDFEIIAKLKQQNILDNDVEFARVKTVKSFNILLLSVTEMAIYDNYPTIQLAEEFKLAMELDWAKTQVKELMECIITLNNYSFNEKNERIKGGFKVVNTILDNKLDELKNNEKEAFKRYSSYKKKLFYVKKGYKIMKA